MVVGVDWARDLSDGTGRVYALNGEVFLTVLEESVRLGTNKAEVERTLERMRDVRAARHFHSLTGVDEGGLVLHHCRTPSCTSLVIVRLCVATSDEMLGEVIDLVQLALDEYDD